MKTYWILFISVILLTCNACTVKYPVVGSFEEYNEVFKGNVVADLSKGTAYIEVEGKVSNVRCYGNAKVTYIPLISYFLPVCEGQSGIANLRCYDGRIFEATYTILSCGGTGYGSGFDQKGNRVTFTFGMAEAEAQEYIQKERKVASQKPELPPIYEPKETRKEKGFSTGTGFFVSNDGYLITNYHVIEDSKKITVITIDKRELEARIIKTDPPNDVALLKVDTETKALPLSGHTLSKGEEVFTLGYPLITVQGQEQKATFGRINSLSGIADDIRFIQIDVPVQPGNSGGPLINMNGYVVGIVTATLDQLKTLRASGALPQNVNYAVKIDYVIPLLNYFLGDKLNKRNITTDNKKVTELIKLAEPSVVLIIAK